MLGRVVRVWTRFPPFDVPPNETAKQSSLAKTTQLIIRRDIGELPAFSIIGAQSLGPYVWDTMIEAGREFGLVPIGRAALDVLIEA